MKHCNKCDVDINTNEKYCPLCQAKLEGKNSSVYPVLKSKAIDVILKIILFISLVSIFINCYIDYVINNKLTYSIFVILGVVSFYILIKYIFKSVHKDLLSVFYNIMLIVIILLFIWFGATKTDVIVSIIIPSITIFDLLLSTILALILRKNYIKKYIYVIFMNILLSIIPVILVFANITNDLVIAHIAFIFAMITVFYLVVFDYQSLKEEVQKMFYI